MANRYLITKVGIYNNCTGCFDIARPWNNYCGTCGILVCDKHSVKSEAYNEVDELNGYIETCELCTYVPDEYRICEICDCPSVSSVSLNGDISDNMGFCGDHVANIFNVHICDYCTKNYIVQYLKPKFPKSMYQTEAGIYHLLEVFSTGHGWIKEGNDFNYKLIQDGREQIIEYYKETIPLFILPEVAAIIIDYCGFSRKIVLKECDNIIF